MLGQSFGFEKRIGGARRFGFLFGTATGLLHGLLFRHGTGQGRRSGVLSDADLFCGPFGRNSLGRRPRQSGVFGLSVGLGLPGGRGGGFGLHPGAMHRGRGGIVFQRGTDGGSRCPLLGLLRLAPGGFGGRLIGLDSRPQFGAQARIRGGADRAGGRRVGSVLPERGRRILGSKPATLALGGHQVG